MRVENIEEMYKFIEDKVRTYFREVEDVTSFDDFGIEDGEIWIRKEYPCDVDYFSVPIEKFIEYFRNLERERE